jgi:hypothetical protein
MFQKIGKIANNTESNINSVDAESFNAKFEKYATDGDSANIEIKNNNGTIDTKAIKYKYIFTDGTNSYKNKTGYKEYYNQLLVFASQNLNNVTDIISAVNSAIDVNYQNNNSYKYNYTEVASSVEIIVDLTTKTDFAFNTGNYKYLLIEPNKNVEANSMYGTNSITTDKGTNTLNKEDNALNVFPGILGNKVSTYQMLSELRESKVIYYDNKAYTVYKYYFTGSIYMNEKTGLIETVKFTLMEDKNF